MGETGLEPLVDELLGFVQKGLDHLLLGNDPHDLTLDEEVASSPAGGDPDVGFPRLTGAVDHASHDGDLDREIRLFQCLLGAGRHLDHIHLGTTTGRTGNQIQALAFPEPEEFQ